MPKNKVSGPITDQEIAFALLILSGAMTDRAAAEAVGLSPDSAAYTKAKPRVRAYMLEHRAAVQQQPVPQEADLSRLAVDEQRRSNLDRQKVLHRLWEIANLSPEMTRGSVTGQVKALSMIVAIQGLIPDRRSLSSEKKSAPVLPRAEVYVAEWLRNQKATTKDPQPNPDPGHHEDQQQVSPAACPASPGASRSVPRVNKPAANSAAKATPDPTELSSRLPRPAVGPERPVPACRGSVVEGSASAGPSPSTPANRVTPAEAQPADPYVRGYSFVPDARGPLVPDSRVPFSIKKKPFNPFARRS